MSDSKPGCPIDVFLETDVANSKRFSERFADEVVYTDEAGWLAFNGKRWADGKHAVVGRAKTCVLDMYNEVQVLDDQQRQLFLKHIKRSQGLARLLAMIELSKGDLLRDLADFDADPYLLNVDNGTIDLRTGVLGKHSAGHYCSKIAPVSFDAAATCPDFLAFLNQIMGNDETLTNFLQRITGYLLSGLTTEQCLFLLLGPGANGKSVFREVLRALLGSYAAMSPEAMICKGSGGGNSNDVARLPGARMVAVSELTDGMRLNEGRIKDLTGGDVVVARQLYREYFEFIPNLKLVLTGNHKPNISGTDDGIWRRIHLVPFDVKIPEDSRDPFLLDKLKAELPGILNWALAGFRDWQVQKLNPPPVVVNAGSSYRAEMDVLGQFFSDCCETDNPRYEVRSKDLLASYNAWANSEGAEHLSSVRLAHLLTLRSFQKKRTNSGIRWLGLRLKSQNV